MEEVGGSDPDHVHAGIGEEGLQRRVGRVHLAGAAILLLVTHRPGYQPPWLARALATQIALPQLLPAESLTVVQSVLQHTTLPPLLLQTLLSRAAGNPFFLEELTWAVLEIQPIPAVMAGIPETIQGVLAARIDHLPPASRAFKEWPKIFNQDSTLTAAILDRLLHHAETIVIEGRSFRMKDQLAQ